MVSSGILTVNMKSVWDTMYGVLPLNQTPLLGNATTVVDQAESAETDGTRTKATNSKSTIAVNSVVALNPMEFAGFLLVGFILHHE